jgi:hypothetical protein
MKNDETLTNKDWPPAIIVAITLLAVALICVVECIIKPLFSFLGAVAFIGLWFILRSTNHGNLAVLSMCSAISLIAICALLNIAKNVAFRERKPFLWK